VKRNEDEVGFKKLCAYMNHQEALNAETPKIKFS
jgi:hypothetical protein